MEEFEVTGVRHRMGNGLTEKESTRRQEGHSGLSGRKACGIHQQNPLRGSLTAARRRWTM